MLQKIQNLARETFAELNGDRWIFIAISTYAILVTAVVLATGEQHLLSFRQFFPHWQIVIGLFLPALFVLGDLAWRIVVRRRRPDMVLAAVFGGRSGPRLLAGFVLVQFFFFFNGAFSTFKNAMPAWRGGFSWDTRLAEIDKWLHLGVDPLAYLAQCCADPRLFSILEGNYSRTWYLLAFGSLAFVIMSPAARAVRNRFIFVFMATWIVCGNLFAYAYLSAGPVYFGDVTGDADRFSVLSEILALGEPGTILTPVFQEYLWTAYEEGTAGLGTGISAFPSVHVGAVFMLTLFAFEYGRVIGWLMLFYTAAILFSSVLLGWHYAIDGYFSILVVYALYRLANGFAIRGEDAARRPQPVAVTGGLEGAGR